MENTNTEDKSKGKSLKDIIDIPPETLTLARKAAYNLYLAEKWDDLEVMLQGILAADNRDAWALSLFGAMMRKQNRFKEALVLMETAHALAPDDENIKQMRDELVSFGKTIQSLKQSGPA